MKRPDRPDRGSPSESAPRHGTAGQRGTVSLARALSKLGFCSRAQGDRLTRAGTVRVNGVVVRDPSLRVTPERDVIEVDGARVARVERVYLMLNKPRGVITTAADEQGRDTVYALLADAGLPWLAPVGRLDKASEGLLLLTNDSAWAARITAPDAHLDKTYHVQVDRLPDALLLDALSVGIDDRGERLALKSVRELRRGDRNAWLEIVLDEGRNRQIRRVLAAFDIGVLRLVRVAIGTLVLGELAKGAWRPLGASEVASVGGRRDS